MFHRQIKLPETNSFFLFGARGSGKTTLLQQTLAASQTAYINLLLDEEEIRYLRQPDSLIAFTEALPENIHTIVIDEVQKVPKLLDLVHHLLESKGHKHRFILTGSSARKLKHGSANLLAGRAFVRLLFPLTILELGNEFDLQNSLSWGQLPRLFQLPTTEEKRDFLQSYARTYLREEIQAEQLVRKVEPFHRFLEVAAQCNGKIISFSNIAKDTRVDGKTVKSFYEILDDTLLGFFLEPFHTSVRKRLRTAPKFYFFDVGVARALARQLTLEPHPSTSYYGDLFEQFIIVEVYKKAQYANQDTRLSFIHTHDDAEIDLVIERPGKPLLLVEIKSTKEVRPESVRNLKSFAADFPDATCELWSLDTRAQKFGSVLALHWQEGIAAL